MVHIRTSVQTKAQQTDIVFLQELQWMQDPREMLKRTFQEYNIHVPTLSAPFKRHDVAILAKGSFPTCIYQEEVSNPHQLLLTVP
ncbi:hypothetical protein LPJ70_005941, partial [Coemansia sp. RSA 2708]